MRLLNESEIKLISGGHSSGPPDGSPPSEEDGGPVVDGPTTGPSPSELGLGNNN